MNKTAFRITRNILSEKMKVWALLIVFLSGANWVNAQRIFSINSEGSIQRAIQQDGQVQVTDERLGASEQAREFEYNTQLITLTKENEGDILSLDFFEDKKFNGKIQNVTRYMNGVTGITAKIDNSLFNFCHIAVSESGIILIADLLERNESYITIKNGVTTYLCRYKAITLREKELPCEGLVPPTAPIAVHAQGIASQSGTGTLFPPDMFKTLPDDLSGCGSSLLEAEITIDLMVVYTEKARLYTNDQIDNYIGIALQKANTAMTNSNTNISFNLVYAYETDYEDTNGETALYGITNPNDGIMDEIHDLRKEHNADLVTLFSNFSDGTGGVGWVLGYENGIPDHAFSVCLIQQVTTGTTMVHEIGHNMGCSHHKAQGGNGLYSYSHGWRDVFQTDGQKFSTIMTYTSFDAEGYFPPIDYFSDPDISLNDTPIGDISDGNNALTLRQTKLLTSLYSNVINTSLTAITLSAGILSPAFDPDKTDYEVEVANSVTSISISGTANYDCATIIGEVTDMPLETGANIITLTVISHDGNVSKSYKIIVFRDPTDCYSYDSRPVFPEDISAQAGDVELNFMMSPAAPTTDINTNAFSLDMPAGSSPYIMRESVSSNVCYSFENGNYLAYLNVQPLKVSQSGNYRFTVSRSAILSFFNSEIPSCESFITSNAYWSGNGPSFYYGDNYVEITMEANTMYYLRLLIPRQPTDPPSDAPLEISITGIGVCYTESIIPFRVGYTYIAVDQSDNTIKVQSATGNFRTLSAGDYTVFGMPYSTIGTSNPSVFVDKTVSELLSEGCFTLSATSVDLTITGTSSFFGISIGCTTGGSVSFSSPSSSDGSAVLAGEKVTLAITSNSGYELKDIDVYDTNDSDVKVMLDDTDGEQSFIMPGFAVTIMAKFGFTDDQQVVLAVKDAIDAFSLFTFVQEEADDVTLLKSALVSAINTLLADEGINYSVIEDDVTFLNLNFATTGTADNILGTDGDFSFIVTLKIGAATTEEITMTKYGVITATPYDNTQDNADISAVKQAVENASFTALQENISTIEDAKIKVLEVINDLNPNNVSITIIDETFTAAIAGTAQNEFGTEGSYTFKVELQKGAGDPQTTVQLTLTITATPYDTTLDNNDIAAAQMAIEGATYTTTQADVQNQSQARAKVESIIAGLSLNGVSTEVVEGLFTAAIEGVVGSVNGTEGSFTFTVKLNKGGGTEVITDERTLTISATPYDATQDNADIDAAKATLESATFTTTQALVSDIAGAKTEVEAIISSLSLSGVTTMVVDDAFTGATAGTVSTPNGTNGIYQFTVELTKGGGTPQGTGLLTLAITATPYTPPATYLVTIATTTYGTVTVDPINPVTENTTVKLSVAPAEGYELDDITTYNTNDVNEIVPLSGARYLRTFLMPAFNVTVEATFKKTIEQIAVETAIQLINSMTNISILQASAHTETDVKAELVQMLNDLPGMSATGITIIATDITISGFTAAVEGTGTNLTGANGSFTFTVTLKKTNSASLTSSTKNGVITATAYDPTQDNLDIIAARTAIEGASYTDYQLFIQTQGQARAKVEAVIVGLNLNGVATDVVDGVFKAAIDGTVSTPGGEDGNYKFTVKLNKGGGTEVITSELTLFIYATPYNPSQDNNDILAAKAIIENTIFINTQMNVPDIASAKTAVEAILSILPLNDVLSNVIDGAFIPAIAGTVSSTGTNGSYTFTVELHKGDGAQQETDPLTLTITPTPYTPPNTFLVNIALTNNGTVTVIPANPVDETAIVTLTISPSEGYELDDVNAFNTDVTTAIVALTGTDDTRIFPMPPHNVTIEASFVKSADQTDVEDAIHLINNWINISILQTTANTIADVKDELVQMINSLPGMSATGITVVANDIVLLGFTAAMEGTTTYLSGTNGSFVFAMMLKKNNSATLTSSTKIGAIIATAYDPTQDNMDIVMAKTLIEGANYVDLQVNILTQVHAKAKVEAIIADLNLNGVNAEVIDGAFMSAMEGTANMPNGTNGSYKFKVRLNKGGGTTVITNELTLVITATPYNVTQDNDDITSVKDIVEGAIYVTTELNAPDIVSAKAVVEAIITSLPLNGVTTNVVNGTYTAATTGSVSTPNGTGGSYTFTVELTKGAGTMETTALLTLTISATPFTPPDTYILNINPTTYGTVTVYPGNPVDVNASVTLTITPAAGYELYGFQVYNTNDAMETVAFTGNDNTRNFLMPPFDVTVEATFKKTADQIDVETAIGLIDGLSNMSVLQETANTEATVKSWLAQQINALPGMTSTGITVDVSDIAISGFVFAAVGTPSNAMGNNGSFSFFVTLTKPGSATVQSTFKSGVIIATAYTSIQYDVTIEPTVNGTVTPNRLSAMAGTSVLLSIVPAQGHELNIISAYKTGDEGIIIPLTVIGTSREFTMPAYDVSVYATFQKTADQIAVEAAKTAVENMVDQIVSQSTANTEATVKNWLTQQINALPEVSANGIVVTASGISFSSFTAAVAGTESNPTGTNGSFVFAVNLRKGNSTTVTTANKNGVIIATSFAAPLYSIYFNPMSNGTVTVIKDYASAGETVTLTIVPDQGYESESLTITPTVTITGSGNTRTFVMPANYVMISATFKKTEAQLEKEALEAVQMAIEGGAYRIAQGTGNTEATVRTWLINTLGVMFGSTYHIQPRAVGDPIIGDVTVTSITPAESGTDSNPSGTNGAFIFTVSLNLGSTTLTTTPTSGVIVAIPYPVTPLKRIELQQLNDLTVRILNTGNVETGVLTLALTGTDADVFLLTESTANSLSVGGEKDLVLGLRTGLNVGEYKATLVVSGENLSTTSLEITYTVTVTGNDALHSQVMSAWTQNGMLHVSGLKEGQSWSVYGISGVLVYRSIADSEEAKISLPNRGFYIVISGENTVKVVW